jgi:two-component system NtrC family sensor kinase
MPAEKILVVDDSADMRDLVATYVLRPNGYETLTANDGLRGLELARQHLPDLIIADMKMPQMSGLDMTRALQAEGHDVPVILITAEGSEELARQALRTGIADYLIKPFDPEELLKAVRRTLALAQARRENARMQAELAAANASLTRRLKELETLAGVGRNVTSSLDLDQVLAQVVEAAVNLTGAEEGALLLLDEQTDELVMRAAKNFDESFVRTFRLPSEDSLAGQVLRTGLPVTLDERTPQKIKTEYLVQSLVYVPLAVRGRVIGVLGVDNRNTQRLIPEYDQHLLQALGDYAAIAIENARLYTDSETERTQLDTLLHEIEDGVMVVNDEQRIILINRMACEAFGIDPVGAVGQPLAAVIQNADARELLSGKGRKGEIALEDGRVFNAHLTPIAKVGYAVVIQDITQLKRIDRIKSDFVSTVSHDLRSPLTAILGYVELMGRVGPVNEQQAEFIKRVRQSVQSITALIGDLLDLGRLEAGFDTQKEATSLQLIMRYAVDGLKQQSDAKHLSVLLEAPADLPSVLANPLRLRQMVTNLLDNAIKYTPQGGALRMAAWADGDQVVMTVRDSGIGIPAADQPFIFDKFYRASNARTEFTGTGLGLSIVRSIVENHGGRIWLESKSGEGTTFTVVLPKYQEEV